MKALILAALAVATIGALMAGPNLITSAADSAEAGRGLLVSLLGLAGAVVFSALLARAIDNPRRR